MTAPTTGEVTGETITDEVREMVREMVRDAVLAVLEDQAATVLRGNAVLRSGTKERRQALEFCADVIASRVAAAWNARHKEVDRG